MHDLHLFLDSFFEQIKNAQIDISGLPLDHIAYQASSAQDYDQRKPEFLKRGEEVSEEIIGGRRVAIFRLYQPILYKSYSVPALELIEPREGQICDSAFQHAELVLDQSFDTYMAKYPHLHWDTTSMSRPDFAHLKLNFSNGLTLKFLRVPILEVVSLK